MFCCAFFANVGTPFPLKNPPRAGLAHSTERAPGQSTGGARNSNTRTSCLVLHTVKLQILLGLLRLERTSSSPPSSQRSMTRNAHTQKSPVVSYGNQYSRPRSPYIVSAKGRERGMRAVRCPRVQQRCWVPRKEDQNGYTHAQGKEPAMSCQIFFIQVKKTRNYALQVQGRSTATPFFVSQGINRQYSVKKQYQEGLRGEVGAALP